MTDEEFVREMRKTFDYSKTIWLIVKGEREKSSKVIFYLSALRKIEREPFDVGLVHDKVIKYIQGKLDEAFQELSPIEIEDVVHALEDLGYLRSETEEYP